MYGARVGADLSNRLYRYYMNQNWLFHTSNNSSTLINKIATESQRITYSIINHIVLVNSKIIMAFLMTLAICIYNFWMAVSAALIFSISYLLIYKIAEQRLIRNGATISKMQALRFRLMNEGFGGIKDTLLLGRAGLFNDRFGDASNEFARVSGNSNVLSLGPRYIMELAAFSLVIILVAYLFFSFQGDISSILPLLSVFALAGFKLLPGFQQIYYSFSTIRGNVAALENLREDLEASTGDIQHRNNTAIVKKRQKLLINHLAQLKDIHFSYPKTSKPTLNGINISIPSGKVVGLVGPSGSGKSTIVDVILGLITPSEGEILLDGKNLTNQNKRSWQNNLGFVAQRIFLADSTIRENIAFGLAEDQIDDSRVASAASMAQLDEMLDNLPNRLETIVGERGIQLSGGQCQRIGIARALYHDAEVLIMDEATSSLDGISEKKIMQAIHDLSGQKTIILIAHRLNTVKSCDTIYILDNGKVVDEGSYQDLVNRNDIFKEMSKNS
jgi:HlyD family secretion protein